MRIMHRCILTILGLTFAAWTVPAVGAPPKLTALYPSGGAIGSKVEVTASGSFGHWPVKCWVDRPGISVEPAEQKGKLSITVAQDSRPGVYWIRLIDDEGATPPRPFLVGTLPELLENEPNDELGKAQAVELPRVVNGRLGKNGDVDTFAVTLKKGETLVASVEANRTIGSPMDSILQIVTSTGFVVADNDDYHDLDSQCVLAAPADGTYFVRLFGFPATPTATIGFAGGDDFVYRVTLTTGPFLDYVIPLALGAAAEDQNVELHGWNIPESARVCAVHAVNAGDSIDTFRSDVAGIATVRVEPHPSMVEQEPNDRDTPQGIQVPVTITGRIGKRGDVDVFRFQAKKGEKFLFRAESRQLGFPMDPFLRITDASGKTLAELDDTGNGRDAELAYTASDDAEYRIWVRDLNGFGGSRSVYRLQCIHPQPEFSLKVAADSFVVPVGKPLEIPVTIERLNGYADEVEIVAEGLPDGLAAMPGKSMNSGDSAKTVKLVVTSSATELRSGTFRVIGRGPAGQALRSATVPIPNTSATTADLWITAPAPKAGQ
jgi:hypothetical protein